MHMVGYLAVLAVLQLLGTPLYWPGLLAALPLLALLCLGMHAWVGLWAVFTDYLTERLLGTVGNVLRLLAQVASALIMFTYVVWGIQILWGL